MANPLKDVCPDSVGLPASDDAAVGISSHVEQFACPSDAFCYYFDEEVIDKLCEWMNIKANEYFTATGKKKVNGLQLLFLSLL